MYGGQCVKHGRYTQSECPQCNQERAEMGVRDDHQGPFYAELARFKRLLDNTTHNKIGERDEWFTLEARCPEFLREVLRRGNF